MNIFVAFIGAVFEIYIADMFFVKFGNKKFENHKHCGFIGLLILLLTFLSVALSQNSFMLLAFSFCVFLNSFLFDVKLLKRILLSFAVVITGSLSEMIVLMATTTGLNTSVDVIQNSLIMYFVCLILSKFLSFAILKPIKNNFGTSTQKFPLWFNFGVSVLPFTSVFIIVLLYRYSLIVNEMVYQVSTLAAAVLLVLANLLILFVIDKQEVYLRQAQRLSFAEAHIKNQITHYSELYAQQEAIKKFRHDSKNFYTSLVSVLETLPPEEAISYIEDKIDIEPFEDRTINSGHPVIDAIIHAKNHQAQKLGAQIKSAIKITGDIYIDELELGVLIGNALDNSIEAVGELDHTFRRNINLNIYSSGDMLSISVSNPTCNNVDVNSIKTTKKDKLYHGYGLNTIEAITNKYNGQLSITLENNIFTISCILVNAKF